MYSVQEAAHVDHALAVDASRGLRCALAIRAEATLALTADATATPGERASAADKAAALLPRIDAFLLPRDAIAAIESSGSIG